MRLLKHGLMSLTQIAQSVLMVIVSKDVTGHGVGGGGVCIYIKDSIAYNLRLDLNNDDMEDLWVEILLTNSKPLYAGVCYRTEKNNNLLRCLKYPVETKI